MTRRAPDGTSAVHRAVARLLVEVCRDEVEAVPTGRGATEAVVSAVRHHRIAPLAHVRLREVAPSLARPLTVDRDEAKDLHIRASLLLGEVNHVLADIPWVTFKGPVLSEHAHPVPGLRRYGDVDLLVAPESMREVTRRFLAAGWRVGDYEDMLRNPQTPGEMHWFTPVGIQVDLHWSMINMAARRRLFDVPTTELLARRVPVRVGLGVAWTTDAVDSFVHVCLHAALAGANKLIWLLDVDQLARSMTAWTEVAVRARAWGAQAQVALVLRRASATLGTPVPPSVYRLLGTSNALHALLDAADRVSPVARHRQEASVARLMARAVRPRTIGTLAVVGRNAVRGVGERVARRGRPVPAPVRARAGADVVEEYLTAVEGLADRAGARRSTSAG